MSSALRTLVVLAVAAAACAAFRVVGDALNLPWSDDWTEAALKVAFWVAPCAIALRLWGMRRYGDVAQALGLTRVVARGYGFGLAASLPMIAALPFAGSLHPVPLSVLVSTIVVGPFAEEVLFRGWVFRQLWRRAGWPPAAALVVSAMAFGVAHLANPVTFLTNPYLTVRDLTFVFNAVGAGALFAWIVWRRDSLWPAIGLHTCLNLSWQLMGNVGFAASRGHVYDPTVPNAVRVASIGLAVVLTLMSPQRVRRAAKEDDAPGATLEDA